jgi:hypothetical protein
LPIGSISLAVSECTKSAHTPNESGLPHLSSASSRLDSGERSIHLLIQRVDEVVGMSNAAHGTTLGRGASIVLVTNVPQSLSDVTEPDFSLDISGIHRTDNSTIWQVDSANGAMVDIDSIAEVLLLVRPDEL